MPMADRMDKLLPNKIPPMIPTETVTTTAALVHTQMIEETSNGNLLWLLPEIGFFHCFFSWCRDIILL